MLFILAPSKTMNFDSSDIKGEPTVPVFQHDAEYIAGVIRKTDDLTGLMKISRPLAETVRKKYQSWGEVVKPAIYTYVGDVYKGFYAHMLSGDDVAWAQKHLLIMSGLYGVVRPLDAISGYRLEMKARLAVDGKNDLYEYWGDRLAAYADAATDDGVICVLSSDEYARPVTRFSKGRIITPVFFDKKDGRVKTVPIYSKMMRGVMARWVIDHRVSRPEDLEAFEGQGYAYSKALSKPNQPAFYRDDPKPILWKK